MKNVIACRIGAILLGVCLMPFVAYSQQPIDSVVNSFREQYSSWPSDLIYFQTSKDVYETGEDLWFKAYQLDAQTFGLSDKSKTLYLQMIGPTDSVVWQEKYPVENGIASGHIFVNDELPEGDYFIEGYTRYSFYKNDTIGIIPTRKIKIVRNISHAVATEILPDSAFRFEMFPEGGNLVSGISSQLAFKATDGRGNPVSVKGTIYQDGEPLIEMQSIHDGMGSLVFTPFEDKNYRIELTNGKHYTLPPVYPEGMVLQLSRQDKTHLDFIVTQNSRLPYQEIYLMGQMRGMVCCMARGTLRDSLEVSIPLDNFLYQGIAEFTLFNGLMQPVAERLVYVHPERMLHITAELDKKSFSTREKGTLNIRVTDEAGKPVRANIGISVYDQAYMNPADPVNISNYCYLLSQVRGKIYNSSYYFDKKNTGRLEALDLLLLTQGWRRYVWDKGCWAYEGGPFLTDGINGMQTIAKKRKNGQVRDTEQLISISDAEDNTQFIWADSAGHFTVSADIMKQLQGGGYVYLKPMLSKEFKPELELTDYFPEINAQRVRRQRYYPTTDKSWFKKEKALDLPVISSDSIILLDEVTVTGKDKKPFRDKFMGRLDSLAQIYLGPWVCKHGWLENYKEGYTHHHDPRYCPCAIDGEPRTLPVIGKRYHISKYEYSMGKNGCTFKPVDRQWITYEGPCYNEEELLRMNNLWRTKGYYAAREFYQPDEVDMMLSIPDARNTLLWAPSVITDEKGEAAVSFYCSDINTVFTVVAEGVDGLGLLGNSKSEFRVMRK